MMMSIVLPLSMRTIDWSIIATYLLRKEFMYFEICSFYCRNFLTFVCFHHYYVISIFDLFFRHCKNYLSSHTVHTQIQNTVKAAQMQLKGFLKRWKVSTFYLNNNTSRTMITKRDNNAMKIMIDISQFSIMTYLSVNFSL